jgi:hypothetical protein
MSGVGDGAAARASDAGIRNTRARWATERFM